MSLRYSSPAVLRSPAGVFTVQADLTTDVGEGVYSWGGRLTTTDVAALGARGQGGTLTLSVPPEVDAEVHVAVADLDPDTGGVLLRATGHGRAPYEQDGDITAARGEDGATVYQVAVGGSTLDNREPVIADEPQQVAEGEWCPYVNCDPQRCPEAHD